MLNMLKIRSIDLKLYSYLTNRKIIDKDFVFLHSILFRVINLRVYIKLLIKINVDIFQYLSIRN